MAAHQIIKTITLWGALLGTVCVHAEYQSSDPVELLIHFQATGQFIAFNPTSYETSYLISAKGIAPEVKDDGSIRAHDFEDHKNVIIEGAKITFGPFDPMSPPPIVNFGCEGCTLTFPDGSVLESDTNVPLNGRAFFLYGPVAPDPTQAIATIRMAGCAGLRETANMGRYAGKVGSICFNGVFDFDVSDPTTIPATLTGSSNCTIVLHTPVTALPPQ